MEPEELGSRLDPRSERLYEDVQHVRQGAGDLASAVSETMEDVSQYLQEQLEARPYAVLGIATGVGFVLGGGLASSLTRVAVGFALRAGIMQLLGGGVVPGRSLFAGGEDEHASSRGVGSTGIAGE